MAIADVNSLSFDKAITGQELDRIQSALRQFVNQLLDKQIIDGTLIQNLNLTTGLNSVDNPLRREALGFIVVKQDVQADLWGNDLNETSLNINTSANVVVDLWVF